LPDPTRLSSNVDIVGPCASALAINMVRNSYDRIDDAPEDERSITIERASCIRDDLSPRDCIPYALLVGDINYDSLRVAVGNPELLSNRVEFRL
jgi:hypothetical protein